MKRRGNREGGIDTLPSGRHRVRISHPDGTRESLGTFADLAEAEAVRRGALDLLAAGDAAPAHQVSLLTFEEKYFDLRKLRTRDKAAARERNRYKVHLRAAPFASRPLGAVSRLDIQRWVDKLATTSAADRRGARSLSKESIKKVLRLLKSVFRYALRDGLIESNPVRDIELPAAEVLVEEPWDFLRPQEQTALLTCVAIPETVRLWIAFAMGTGLRSGELHRLRLVDVDIEGEVVRVGQTKTNRPRRVPLFGLALRAARRWLELLPEYCPQNTKGLFWPRPRGGARSGLALPRVNHPDGRQAYEHEVWKGYLQAAGIQRDLRWYDATRHTCATSLLCGFWGPRWALSDVAKVLGHTSTKTTERYAHVADEVVWMAGAATTASDLVTAIGHVAGHDPLENPARHARFEPATFGSGERAASCKVAEIASSRDQSKPLEVLRALAVGNAEDARAGGLELAREVLDSPLARAALAVIEGGEFLDARIVDLCEQLLARDADARRSAA